MDAKDLRLVRPLQSKRLEVRLLLGCGRGAEISLRIFVLIVDFEAFVVVKSLSFIMLRDIVDTAIHWEIYGLRLVLEFLK